jgi:hypothetical protein
LGWFLNGTEVGRYVHKIGDENKLPLNVEYADDLGPVRITRVEASATSDNINATATFTTNTSVLEDLSNIQCGRRAVISNLVMVNVSTLGKSLARAYCWNLSTQVPYFNTYTKA